jgi:hypothetical protein
MGAGWGGGVTGVAMGAGWGTAIGAGWGAIGAGVGTGAP